MILDVPLMAYSHTEGEASVINNEESKKSLQDSLKTGSVGDTLYTKFDTVSHPTDAVHSMSHSIADKVPVKKIKAVTYNPDSIMLVQFDTLQSILNKKIKNIGTKLYNAVEAQGKGQAQKIQNKVSDLMPDKSIISSKTNLKKLIRLGAGSITMGSTIRYSEGIQKAPLHYQLMADVRGSVSVGMLPFNIGAAVTYGDRQFNYQFTKIGFDFNSSAFLDSMKNKAMSKLQTDQLKDMANVNLLSTAYQIGIREMDSTLSQIQNSASYTRLRSSLEKYENKYANEAHKLGEETVSSVKDSAAALAGKSSDSLNGKAANTKTYARLKQIYDTVQILKGYYDKANEIITQAKQYKETLQQGYDQIKTLEDNKDQLSQLSDGKDQGAINKLLGANKMGFNKLIRTFAFVNKLSVGSSILNASPLTAMNYRLNGIQVEYNRSYIVGLAAGLNNFRIIDYLKTHQFDSRFIVHARLGYGDLKKNYIVINYGYGKILNNSMRQTATDYSSSVASYIQVFGLETQWLYKKKIQAKGEIAYSLTRNVGNHISGALTGTISKPTIDQMAFMGEVKGDLDKGFTYRAAFSYLGGAFKNFNEAYQNNNLIRWDAGLVQKLFKKRLIVSLKYVGFKNNLNHATSYGSVLHQPLLNISLQVPKWPVVTIISAPMYQDMHIDTMQTHNTNIMHSISIVYPYFKRNVTMSSMITVTLLNTRLIGEKRFTSEYHVIVQQTISYKSVTTAFDLGYSRSLNVDLYSGELGVSCHMSKNISTGASFKAAYLDYSSLSYGGSVNVTCDFKKFGLIKVSAEQSSLPNFFTHSFQNFLLGNFMYTKRF